MRRPAKRPLFQRGRAAPSNSCLERLKVDALTQPWLGCRGGLGSSRHSALRRLGILG